MVVRSKKDWANKLDNALWAYYMDFKTPFGIMPYSLIYDKSCHLPIGLEHKAFWAIKFLNFDLKGAGEKKLLQLHKIEEIHSNAYGSSKVYKRRMKSWHDQHIHQIEFQKGDLLLLFKSKLKLFPGKLSSRCSGPFMVMKVCPHRVIDIGTEVTRTFKVNRSWLKHYYVGEPIDRKVSYNLPDATSS